MPLSIHDKFKQKVEEHGGAAKVAAILGCSTAYVYMLEGARCPSRKFSRRIQEKFGLHMSEWDGPALRSKVG